MLWYHYQCVYHVLGYMLPGCLWQCYMFIVHEVHLIHLLLWHCSSTVRNGKFTLSLCNKTYRFSSPLYPRTKHPLLFGIIQRVSNSHRQITNFNLQTSYSYRCAELQRRNLCSKCPHFCGISLRHKLGVACCASLVTQSLIDWSRWSHDSTTQLDDLS